jgi:hypothetical protein
MRTSWPAKHASPGLGVSKAPLSSPRARRRQGDAVALAGCASASAQVLGSGTVGPLAMTRVVARHVADQQRHHPRRRAGRASRPPLIADRCLRTQFISSIAAPLASSAG